MTTRLLILFPLTIGALVLTFTTFSYGDVEYTAPLFFLFCTLIGAYGISRAFLSAHRKFKLVDNTLVVDSLFDNVTSIDLDSLSSWREFEINIRSQKRVTLILFFEKGKKVVVDNNDYDAELTELRIHLSKEYPDRKVKSAT